MCWSTTSLVTAKALSHLVAVLEPGGLILVGLYSTYARKEISSIRNKFTMKTALRFQRQVFEESDKSSLERVSNRSWMNFSPFFSISGFKDLFFNVQEHTYTLGQISSLLKKNGLRFCGLSSSVYQLALNSEEIAQHRPFDINYWAEYEKRNSTTFARMYQFWCQKL